MSATVTATVRRFLFAFMLTASGWARASDSNITYQGQLTLNGEKVTQPYDFTFDLWTQMTGGDRVGGPLTMTLQVEDGVFTAVLDFGSEALRTTPLFLQVTAGCENEPPAVFPRQRITAAPYALHTRGIEVDASNNMRVDGEIESTTGGFRFPDGTRLASTRDLVPVGTVVDFWLDPRTNALPDGWEICDGQPVADAESPIFGMVKPDFRSAQFVRGTSDPDEVGQTGGSYSTSTEMFDGQTEEFQGYTGPSLRQDDPNHGERAQTGDSLGGHNHKWAVTVPEGNSVSWYTFDGSGNQTVQASWAFNSGPLTADGFPLMASATTLNPTNPPDLHTDNANLSHHHDMRHNHDYSHSHRVPHKHDVTLPPPPYVGMLKIIRVR